MGIVGNAGAYGRWLSVFFRERMGLQVIGRDPAGDAVLSPRELALQADVLIFSAPIRHSVAVIDDYVAAAAGDEAGKLWLDLTSIKQAPVEAMLRSRAEVVGLHPMAAPPKIGSLKGRVLGGLSGTDHALAVVAGRTVGRAGSRMRPARTARA